MPLIVPGWTGGVLGVPFVPSQWKQWWQKLDRRLVGLHYICIAPREMENHGATAVLSWAIGYVL